MPCSPRCPGEAHNLCNVTAANFVLLLVPRYVSGTLCVGLYDQCDLSSPGPVSKTQALTRNGKPPRLSMIYGDELSTGRVHTARESLFMDMSGMEAGSDDFEPPELDDDVTISPLPDRAMLKKQVLFSLSLSLSPPSFCTFIRWARHDPKLSDIRNADRQLRGPSAQPQKPAERQCNPSTHGDGQGSNWADAEQRQETAGA